MKAVTLYKVQVYGVIAIEADDDQDAKDKALTYFAASPQQYLSILEQNTALIEGEES